MEAQPEVTTTRYKEWGSWPVDDYDRTELLRVGSTLVYGTHRSDGCISVTVEGKWSDVTAEEIFEQEWNSAGGDVAAIIRGWLEDLAERGSAAQADLDVQKNQGEERMKTVSERMAAVVVDGSAMTTAARARASGAKSGNEKSAFRVSERRCARPPCRRGKRSRGHHRSSGQADGTCWQGCACGPGCARRREGDRMTARWKRAEVEILEMVSSVVRSKLTRVVGEELRARADARDQGGPELLIGLANKLEKYGWPSPDQVVT